MPRKRPRSEEAGRQVCEWGPRATIVARKSQAISEADREQTRIPQDRPDLDMIPFRGDVESDRLAAQGRAHRRRDLVRPSATCDLDSLHAADQGDRGAVEVDLIGLTTDIGPLMQSSEDKASPCLMALRASRRPPSRRILCSAHPSQVAASSCARLSAPTLLQAVHVSATDYGPAGGLKQARTTAIAPTRNITPSNPNRLRVAVSHAKGASAKIPAGNQ